MSEYADLVNDDTPDDDGPTWEEYQQTHAENARLRAALRTIADEESRWRFRVDPLEHARSVVDEMRDLATAALGGDHDD